MGRTNLPVTDIIRTSPGNPGVLVAGDDTDNHDFVNDGRTIICVLKTGGAGILTFITPGTVEGLAIADLAVTPATHATRIVMIGPFPPGVFNQSDGVVHVDLDDETTFSLGAFRLPA